MSLGPEKIILILVVALIVFGPQRLPEIARQVGAAMRELRRMQDTVRGELESVLHPDLTPAKPGATHEAVEDVDHAALPPAGEPEPSENTATDDNITDDGFSGPRSFS
jgi:sec-independent protein translocase protein TatB